MIDIHYPKKSLPLIKQNFENIPGFIQNDSFKILVVIDEGYMA